MCSECAELLGCISVRWIVAALDRNTRIEGTAAVASLSCWPRLQSQRVVVLTLHACAHHVHELVRSRMPLPHVLIDCRRPLHSHPQLPCFVESVITSDSHCCVNCVPPSEQHQSNGAWPCTRLRGLVDVILSLLSVRALARLLTTGRCWPMLGIAEEG